jgi:hypothetical protein
VLLTDVKKWINSGELVRAYKEWKIVSFEGEEHLDPRHDHEGGGKKYFRRAPAMKNYKRDL